ncbi:MAG: type II toxin-antitoxin system VapC family toxin [Planctomycetes bacterium]|nr:type II toxin-antitoxin system VapC family toxin [Planctomycetota bacterium]
MRYLLDTNIVSYALRGQHGIEEKLAAIPKRDLLLSAVVLGEGLTGSYKTARPQMLIDLWRSYVAGWELAPFDEACADAYGRIRAHLEQHGRMIGIHDCQIAATALAYAQTHEVAVTVVTDNMEEFKRVPGLKVVNWVKR